MVRLQRFLDGLREEATRDASATVDALLDAALDLLRQGGYEELTVREVATRAGVTAWHLSLTHSDQIAAAYVIAN